MAGFLMAAGRLGRVAAFIGLLIILLKKLVALVGLLAFDLKVGIILAFIALMLLIVIAIMSAPNRRRREAEEL